MPYWQPENQLRGMGWFSKLRAVVWARSIWLAEWAQFRSKPWWWKMHAEVKRAFKDLCPFELARQRNDVRYTYGETPAITVVGLLDRLGAQPPLRFVDLGCGRGYPCFAAAGVGYQALGWELQEELVERANRAAAQLELPARFEVGDFLNDPLPEADIYFADVTALEPADQQALLERLLEKEESYLILGDFNPQSDRLERLGQHSLPVYWGVAEFYLFQVRSQR